MTSKSTHHNASEYIAPLNMNGLQGRMLHLPPPPKHKTREFLVLYGHHALLERWWSLVQNFNEFGAVTMPDMPGFGGMDSFYKIGKRPTIDNLADYLASFIKLRYKRRRVVIVGISFGFVVATRMLQRYPDLAKRVDFVISAAGFTHHDDFSFSRPRMIAYRIISRVVAWPIVWRIFRVVCLNSWVLRKAYSHTHTAKHKFAEVSTMPDKFAAMMDIEIKLWHANDVRTHWVTTNEFLRLDNCDKRIHLPVWDVHTTTDQYFNNRIVEQHMRIIFDEYESAPVNMKHHVVSVLADKKETAVLVPPKLRRYLNKTA